MENVILNGDKERLFPRALYKQCIWIAKDYRRLYKIAELASGDERFGRDEYVLYGDEFQGLLNRRLVEDAVRKVVAVQEAMEIVPEEFRQPVMANVVDGIDFEDKACYNTWKKYKRKFVLELARKLNLY